MRILESDRLLLKPVEPEDLPLLLALRWDQELMNHVLHEPLSLRSQQQWLEAVAKAGDVALSIFVKEAGDAAKTTLAGTVGLYNFNLRHQRATLRARLAVPFQGKGLGREAMTMTLDYGFNTLNLHKIVADSLTDNAVIIGLCKKIGFVEEGLLRAHYFHQGAFKDAVLWGLLRDDFNRSNKQALNKNPTANERP